MAAYVIADIEVKDTEAYARYRQVVPPTIEAFGGRFLARGGMVTVLEGAWDPKRVVILEFDSAEKARQWYDSEDYAAPKAVRQGASRGSLILVEGA